MIKGLLVAAGLVAAAPAVLLGAVGFLTARPAAAEDLPVIGGIPISPMQEGELRTYVGREGAKPIQEPVAVGSRIPTQVELQILPPFLTTEIPVVRTYRYVRTPTGIAIVNPDDRKVVRIFEMR